MGIVRIPGQLAPNGSFPVIDGNDIKGGFYIVDTIEERNSIPAANRKIGLPCYVVNKNMYYRLRGGITNDCWDDWDLDNNGVIINNKGETVKKDVILDIDHSHDHIHCTTLKDENGDKYHIETNTDLVQTNQNKNLTELLNYIIDKIEETNDIPVESVKLDNNFLIVKQDSITKLKVKVLPEENTEKLVWISGDKSIATISEDGILTAIKPGTTFIKVYSNKSRVIDTCSIVVSRENISNKEISDGLICDLNIQGNRTLDTWEDSTGNYNNAELVNFTEDKWETDCLHLDGTQYIKLPIELLNHDISTIEIVADLMFDKDDSKVVKLFAKKNNFKDMNYQINSEFISFGSNGVIKEFENMNCLIGLNVYTFVINKISKEILIYVNGRLFDVIKLEQDESFGVSDTSSLLIASNGVDQSPSEMKINRIRIFDRGLDSEEVLSDSEYLTGYFDGIETAINRYCCSQGRWSMTYPCFSVEDKFYKKSYKYTRVDPTKRYRITLINSNYSGSVNASGYGQDKDRYTDLSYLIYFNNGIAEFSIPNGIYFINFFFKSGQEKLNIYYILEEIN